jgi:hypothetical protein
MRAGVSGPANMKVGWTGQYGEVTVAQFVRGRASVPVAWSHRFAVLFLRGSLKMDEVNPYSSRVFY